MDMKFATWLLAVPVIIGLGGMNCSSSSVSALELSAPSCLVAPSAPKNASNRLPSALPPRSLINAGEYGENIYDFAKAGNWAKANGRLALLRKSAAALRSGVLGATGDADRLDSAIASVGTAVDAKDRLVTMRDANQVTAIVADMLVPFKLPVPIEVTRLDFYGRELEVWSAADDPEKLKSTAAALKSTWDAVRPAVEAHGGAAVAKRFGALVATLESAKTADEYNRMATPILDEVDVLEQTFGKR